MLLGIKQQHCQKLIKNHYVTLSTLSAQDIAKLLQQLKSGFKPTINWNKCQSKIATKNAPNQYLDYLIDPRFQGVNIISVVIFNVIDNRIEHSKYYFRTAETEDGKNKFD